VVVGVGSFIMKRERERDMGRCVFLAHFKRFWYRLIGDEESINEGYR